MKQYKFTSQDFVPEGESGEPDAIMDSADLNALKKLAGIPVIGEGANIATDQSTMSPVGSNISITGTEKRKIEKERGIMPGSDEWFKLWFSRPYLTGEKPVGDKPAPKIKRSR